MVDDKVVDLQTQLLEPQLNIGKAVIESMLEMYYERIFKRNFKMS